MFLGLSLCAALAIFGLIIKLVVLIISNDILVSAYEFCWLQPPVLCVGGRDDATFLSIRDGR